MAEYYSKKISSVVSGRKTVTATGNAEQFVDLPCRYVIITALESNTDLVAIGGADVIAKADNTQNGILLSSRQNIRLDISNMNILWIDSVVSGEGVAFAVFN